MHVYMMEIENTDVLPKTLLQYVSEERQEKIKKYKFNIDKVLSLYSALITRMGIAKLTGVSTQSLVFKANEHGKPYLANNRNLNFNMSHTKNFILCCISEKVVGADVERLNKPPYEIMNNCFHTEEIEYINSISKTRDRRFFEMWTRKEAYVKYCGTGLGVDLIKINTLDPGLQRKFLDFQVGEYICSVFTEDINTPVVIQLKEEDIHEFNWKVND